MGEIKFIVDVNVGKLVHWLRMMGYDSLLFTGEDDGQMLRMALEQDRVILTKDSQFLKRRLITSGKVKALFAGGDDSEKQIKQVVSNFHLDYKHNPFTLCLIDNHPLVSISKEEVKDRVPPHVFKTQESYMECPSCHRVYWQGTHWEAMVRELDRFAGNKIKNKVSK
jgi:uncharacterized protein